MISVAPVVVFCIYLSLGYGYSLRSRFLYRNKVTFCSTSLQSSLEPVEEPNLPVVTSQLPLDFFDAVSRSVACTLQYSGFNGGQLNPVRVKIDFDTTVGDMTYTSLKNTLPFIKEYLNQISVSIGIAPEKKMIAQIFEEGEKVDGNANDDVPTESDGVNLDAQETASANANQKETQIADRSKISKKNSADNVIEASKLEIFREKTITVFFPDMGAAVLARHEWKMNTIEAEVPYCINTANIQNDPLQASDVMAIMICPLSSEGDFVKRVLDMCSDKGIPVVMVNANLINMDQGYGVRKFKSAILTFKRIFNTPFLNSR